MSDNKNSKGLGVLSLLGVAFIILKLANYIDWSWWYVTMPFWGGYTIYLIIQIVLFTWLFIYQATRTPEQLQRLSDIKEFGYPKTERELNKHEYPNNRPKSKSRFQQRVDDAMEKQRNR